VAEHSGSLRVIIAAIAGNVAIAICKFGAALVTGSAAMYSEAIHSTVDTGNELLLLFGMRRADKPPDAEHPFGYGLQLYFWVFVVAVMIFGLGALVAFYEGVEKILHAEPARYVVVNYIVLGASIVFEAGSWYVAFREFRQAADGGCRRERYRRRRPIARRPGKPLRRLWLPMLAGRCGRAAMARATFSRFKVR
jgi:cation diffusion facilitator family transporter